MRRLVILASFLGSAGCFDFSALGPPAADLSVATGEMSPPDLDDGGVLSCAGFDGCPAGQNCIDGQCRGAVASCAAHKQAWPKAGDGVYWIVSGGQNHLAYCDMALGTELCTDVMGAHSGKTREGSNLAFSLVSLLSADGRSCELWALRANDGFPLGQFAKDVPGITLGQCQALGFLDDLALGGCQYGTDTGYSNCGFAVSPLYAYGHKCTGCQLNSGTFTHYVKMGPFTTALVLTSNDGTTRARCKTR